MKPFSHSRDPIEEGGESDGTPNGRIGSASALVPAGAEPKNSATGASAYLILEDLIVPLSWSRETVIGRDNDGCDVVLADPHVSKRHAAVYRRGDRYIIRDLGSLNGVMVNGTRVEGSHPLVCGDRILLAPYGMEFAGRSHARIVRMMQPRAEPTRAPAAGHFAGRLDILSVTDLVQLLNATRQSGILTIVDEDRHSALLSIHRGEILQAQYLDHRGPEAVYALLRRREGQFEFIQGAPAIPARPMQIPTLALLLNGCGMVDEGADPGRDGHERGGLLPSGGFRAAGQPRVELTPPARTTSLPRTHPV